MLVDTHAHLYANQFDKDRAEMLKRALNDQVNRLFLPNVDSRSIAGLYDLVKNHPEHCFPMMGVHPCSIKENYKEELERAKTELDQAPFKFYAVGEIGLDFYWDITFKEQQMEALRTQIQWAKEKKLPIVLHCRESMAETLAIVEEMNEEALTGIFHCFSGNLEQAHRVIALGGFYMGIGGVITYKKSKELRSIVQALDLSHFVLETDAPYLAPEPYRSAKDRSLRRNESAYIVNIAKKIAEVKGVALETVAQITTTNAEKVFQIDR